MGTAMLIASTVWEANGRLIAKHAMPMHDSSFSMAKPVARAASRIPFSFARSTVVRAVSGARTSGTSASRSSGERSARSARPMAVT